MRRASDSTLMSLFGAMTCLLCGCTTLLPETDLCAPGSGPSPAVDHAQPIAGGENHPVSIAVSGGNVVWADQGPPQQDVREGSIVALSLCSGAQRVLARQQSRPSALVVVADVVYWINAGMMNGEGEVWRIPLGASEGAATQLAMEELRPSALAVEGDIVYWCNRGDLDAMGASVPGTGTLRRLKLAGGSVETLASALDAPSALAVRDGVVVWTEQGRGALIDIDPNDGKTELTASYAEASGSVSRLDTNGAGPATRTAEQQDSPVAIALDPQRTVWLDRGLYRGTGSVQRSDGAPLGTGFDFPGGIALDGELVYVAVTGAIDEHEEGHILRQGLDGQSFDLAASQQLPMAIAADRHLAYWVNFGDLTTTNGQVLVRFK